MTIDDRIRDAVNSYVARVRADLETHAQMLTAEVTRAVTAERAEWESQLDRQVAETRADEARKAQQRLDEALAQRPAEPLAAVGQVPQSRVDTLDRLMQSLRRIDESNSLTGILGALARGAAAEASRVAILIVDGEVLRTWEHLGFEEGTAPTEMPMAPGFMRVPEGRTGLVVPLLVGGDVVAVLYADSLDQDGVPSWTEEVQLLTRHAALRLENVTSVRAIEVMAGSD